MKRPACGQCLARGLDCGGYERDLIFVHTARDKKRECRPPPRRVSEARVEVAINGALAKATYEDSFICIFLSDFLPHGKMFAPHTKAYATGNWLNVLPTMARDSPILRKVLVAMGLSTAGHAWDRTREKEEGLRYFTAVLGDMSSALDESK
ncbi:hypothetical protein OQA88_7871 [Cercophora sp. LCS_1]